MREAAKRGDLPSARIIAKELVRTRRATTQLYTNKAHMIGMGTQLQEQLAMVKVAGSLGKSAAVMKTINDMMQARRGAGAGRSGFRANVGIIRSRHCNLGAARVAGHACGRGSLGKSAPGHAGVGAAMCPSSHAIHSRVLSKWLEQHWL